MKFLLPLLFVAAPIPQPQPLVTESLVGWWDYSWGGMTDGWIQFCADGTYYSRHYPGTWPDYTGRYRLAGNVLTLHEGRMPCAETAEAVTLSFPYPIELTTACYAKLVGKCGATNVVLSRRK